MLVGKVTPKGETTLTPEEKLLRAIFGEKASDVKDTSLRVDQGTNGTVIDVQVFTREGIQRDKRAQQIIDDELKRFRLDLNDQLRIVEADAFDRIAKLLNGRIANGGPQKIAKGTAIDKAYLASIEKYHWFDIRPAEDEIANQLESIKNSLEQTRHGFDLAFEEKRKKLTQGDELPAGVLKMVKVYLAVKRRLQPGDKMAGRHGNKGVVSKIVAVEDMPYMADGTPCDIVLNPLGVPSRMNVGQVLEVHLGWAGKGIGQRIGDMLQKQAAAAEIRAFMDELYNKSGGKTRAHRRAVRCRSAQHGRRTHQGRAVRDAGVRRRRRRRDPRHAAPRLPGRHRRSQGPHRHAYPVRRCTTVAPAKPSSARSRSATCTS